MPWEEGDTYILGIVLIQASGTLSNREQTLVTEEGKSLATRGPFPLLAATARVKSREKVWPTRAGFPVVAATARTESLDLGNWDPAYT